MAIAEAVLAGIARGAVTALLNRFKSAPPIDLTYGKTGNNDHVRLHYRRREIRRPAQPWIIIEARVLWPPWVKIAAGTTETRTPSVAAKALRHVRIKPDTGVFFIPLGPDREYPGSVNILVHVERTHPAERRWVLATALRPSNFDLRKL